MKRRSRYALTKVSADLPAHIVQQLDGWKTEIEGINRSQLISDLLRWALEKDAVEALYPECDHDHDHDHNHVDGIDCGCKLGCC